MGLKYPPKKGVEVSNAGGIAQGSPLLQTGLQRSGDGVAERDQVLSRAPNWTTGVDIYIIYTIFLKKIPLPCYFVFKSFLEVSRIIILTQLYMFDILMAYE